MKYRKYLWRKLPLFLVLGTACAALAGANIAVWRSNRDLQAILDRVGVLEIRNGEIQRDSEALQTRLQSQGEVRVLSNPRVSLMNGQVAMLSVGTSRNYISKVQTTTTTPAGGLPQTTFTTETNSILSGLVIGIVPYINPDGNVSMTITPIISNLTKLESAVIGTAPNAVTISLPTVDLREMSTTVRVKDGELVVIGGLIQKSESTKDNGIPFLSKIPLLGYLFKSRDQSELRTELVIMLKPQVTKAED